MNSLRRGARTHVFFEGKNLRPPGTGEEISRGNFRLSGWERNIEQPRGTAPRFQEKREGSAGGHDMIMKGKALRLLQSIVKRNNGGGEETGDR